MMHDTMTGGGMMGPFGGYSFGYGLWNALLFAGVVILILAAILYLLRETGLLARKGRATDEALEILKTRYARGEMTSEEYSKMRKVLED